MKLSCITTVCNEGSLLLNSVGSVLAQSHGDFEYLIVDDGSGAETRAVLDGLDDSRITVIRQANDGPSSARNRALSLATGDYVCFLDADDTRPTWAFEAIAREIRRSDPDLVLCRGALAEDDGQLRPFYDDAILTALPAALTAGGAGGGAQMLAQLTEPQPANKAVRRALLRDRHIGFPNTHFFEDIYFHTMCIAQARRIAVCDSPCFTYYRRFSKAQTTGSRDARRFDVLAVTRLTLDRFAGLAQSGDAAYRRAVLLSCLKLVRWSEDQVTHYHKHHFRELFIALLGLTDPRYLDPPRSLTKPVLDATAPQRAYLEQLLGDPRLAARQSLGDRASDAGSKLKTYLQRLRPDRHA